MPDGYLYQREWGGRPTANDVYVPPDMLVIVRFPTVAEQRAGLTEIPKNHRIIPKPKPDPGNHRYTMSGKDIIQ